MRSTRRLTLCAITASVVVLSSACTTTASDSSGAADSSDRGFLSAEDFATLQDNVKKATARPSFVAPGPPFDASAAKGKKVFVIPTASQLRQCDQIAKDVVALSQKVGMTGTYFQNSGGPAGWIPGMQQAVSQHYDAIVLVCGIDPNLMTPQVKAATQAGIAVIDSGLGDTSDGAKSDPLVTAQTNIPNAQSIRRAMDVAILDHRKEPFTAFLITSNEVPSSVVMEKAIRDEFARYCPKCVLKSTNVAVPDWGTKIQPAVSSALVSDPDIKVVVPIYDGMSAPTAAAIRASGRTDLKMYGCYGGTPEYILQMPKGYPMATNIGPSHLWRAYAVVDQMLRVLTGAGAVPADKAQDPERLFTMDNYQEVTSVPNDGFGAEFPAAYEKLWGLS
ncbi:MAG: sugar ABC transporter substrate-binding protein [Micromonosporaceae bacterium]|nr:sugar ABC transporter substrate-binding protein [Micromonosporaceae bacterium]